MSKGIVSETLQSAYPLLVLFMGIFAAGVQMNLADFKSMHPFQQPTQNPKVSLVSLFQVNLPDCSNVENRFSDASIFCSNNH